MRSKPKSSVTTVPLKQAVGTVLAHDITEIRPGQFKGASFKKGHIIKEEDLPHLKRLGKENFYILQIRPGQVHEDDAAIRLARGLAGIGVVLDGSPSEGKISLRSAYQGLLKVNIEALIELNIIPDISCSSRHNNIFVEKGEIIAATRIIPLIIEEQPLNAAIHIAEAEGGIFSIKKLSKAQTGLVITGNEVYSGLIDDKFVPILRKKLKFFSCKLKDILLAPDHKETIISGIRELLKKGAELIMVAGGMSVDPDDVTRIAIVEAGAEDVAYGTPVFPGAMLLYGRFGEIPVLGIPACVLYYKATILDLVLPRVLAGETITRRDLASMAHGGLCLDCEQCHYPVCPFGK